jgi:hypothetical protein
MASEQMFPKSRARKLLWSKRWVRSAKKLGLKGLKDFERSRADLICKAFGFKRINLGAIAHWFGRFTYQTLKRFVFLFKKEFIRPLVPKAIGFDKSLVEKVRSYSEVVKQQRSEIYHLKNDLVAARRALARKTVTVPVTQNIQRIVPIIPKEKLVSPKPTVVQPPPTKEILDNQWALCYEPKVRKYMVRHKVSGKITYTSQRDDQLYSPRIIEAEEFKIPVSTFDIIKSPVPLQAQRFWAKSKRDNPVPFTGLGKQGKWLPGAKSTKRAALDRIRSETVRPGYYTQKNQPIPGEAISSGYRVEGETPDAGYSAPRFNRTVVYERTDSLCDCGNSPHIAECSFDRWSRNAFVAHPLDAYPGGMALKARIDLFKRDPPKVRWAKLALLEGSILRCLAQDPL